MSKKMNASTMIMSLKQPNYNHFVNSDVAFNARNSSVRWSSINDGFDDNKRGSAAAVGNFDHRRGKKQTRPPNVQQLLNSARMDSKIQQYF